MVVGVRPFRHLQLPQQHRARVAQAPDDGGVMIRGRAAQDGRAGRRWHAFTPAQVLQRYRNAVQRAAVMPAAYLRFGRLRRLQRQGRRHAGVAAQCAVASLDAPQLGARDFHG
ncbi:hypothetical protein D3C85_1270590 [compost metagenome]